MSFHRRLHSSIVVVLACVALAACGTTQRRGFFIPSASGHDREPLGSGALSVERLVTRAQAELEAGHVSGTEQGGGVELWLRRALQLEPENPGALVVLGRLYIARGQRHAARGPLAVAARRAPEVLGEQMANLVALAGEELAAGRVGAAAALVTDIERQLPRLAHIDGGGGRTFREERQALHRELALQWLEHGRREAARASLDAATRLGAGVGRAAIELEALDRSALQHAHTQDVVRAPTEWLALTRWLVRYGRAEDVDWAMARTRDSEPEPDVGAALEGLAAEVALKRDKPAEARERWLAAAALLPPADGERVLATGAEMLKADGFPDDGVALLDDGLRRAPGAARLARARVRWASIVKDQATITKVAVGFVEARPAEWARALAWVWRGPERWSEAAEAVLAAARNAGQELPAGRASEVWSVLVQRPVAVARAAAEAALAPVPRGIVESFLDARGARLVHAWAALDGDLDRREACRAMLDALGTRAMPETRFELAMAWQAAPEDSGDAPPWWLIGEAYLQTRRYDEAVAAFTAALDRPGATAEAVADRFRPAERWDEALLFYDRLHVNEIITPDVMPELARRWAMRGDDVRAEEVASRYIEMARNKEVSAGKLVAFAEQVSPALASEAYAIAIEAGDRTPRAFIGWVRALSRLGDNDGAERVANRFLADRTRRDARAIDELAKALADEGRVARAAELIQARFGENERMELNVLGPLADLMRRAGQDPQLVALVARFVAMDARNPQRAYQAGASRLIEAGLVSAARTLLDQGLEARPRDATLLSSALSVALLRRDAGQTEALAKRLFAATSPGSAIELYERVIQDVRAASMPEAALALADDALERLPGTSRLLSARGRVHLLAGRREVAIQDFDEAVARGGFVSGGGLGTPGASPRDLLGPLEVLFDAARLPGELARIEARALAQAPGRADVVIPYGRALLQADKIEEAEQVFARFLADNDRGHAIVAEAWFAAGKWRRALEHWARGMDQVADVDAPAVLAKVATALAAIAEPERLDAFVRLYVQTLNGRQRASLLPVAKAYAEVGRADEAMHWLTRAEESSPSADLAWEVGNALLARGDDRGAVAAFERCIARRAAEALPTQSTAWFGGAATQPVVNLLLQSGRAALARELVARVEGRYGVSAWTRLLAARTALAEGDLAGVLDATNVQFPPWRTNRDLLPTLRLLLEELLVAGHGQTAMAVVERALEAGDEKELLVASLRIAARSGYPDVALAAAERFGAEHMAAQAWLAAEALLAEGLAATGHDAVVDALTVSSVGPSLTRAAGALYGSGDDIPSVLGRARALGDDRLERAVLLLRLHRLAGPIEAIDNPLRALDAIAPYLDQSFPDPEVGTQALIAAALADEQAPGRLKATIATLSAQTSDRSKWARAAARDLDAAGLPRAALDVLDTIAESDGGDGSLALDAVELAVATKSDRAASWQARVPPGAEHELAERLRRLERFDLADAIEPEADLGSNDATRFATAALASIERSADVEKDRQRCARLALGRVGVDGGAWAHVGRGCLDAWIDEGGVDRGALELGLALAWHDGAIDLAGKRSRELAQRFPGPVEAPSIMVEAAIASGDAAGLAQLFDRPLALPRAQRASLAAHALTGLALLGRTPTPAVIEVLARVAAEAPAADADAATLSVAIAPPGSEGLAAAEAAYERQPRMTAMVLVLAGALARSNDAAARARASALLLEASRRPAQAGLFDLDPKALVGRDRAQVLVATAQVHASLGEHARALSMLREALTLLDPSDKDGIGLALVARGDAARAAGRPDEATIAWTAAARRGTSEGWARAARQRLRARTP